MDKTYFPITGIEALYIAEGIVDTEAGFSANAPTVFAPAENAEWNEDQASKKMYFNNQLMDIAFGGKDNSIVVRISGLPAEVDARIRGISFASASGRTISTGREEPPFCSLGLLINKGGSHVCIWFLKGKFTGGKIVASTKTNDVTVNTLEYTFTVATTDMKWLIDGKMTGVQWIKGDTSNAAFDETAFFSQVQTPDTAAAPAALALSSIVPADGATAIAKNAAIVLTFSNKIAAESIMLINASNGDAVAITKSWNAAGKILTLTPGANLAGSTAHVVAVAGVVDVYGQKLTAVSKDFTTTA